MPCLLGGSQSQRVTVADRQSDLLKKEKKTSTLPLLNLKSINPNKTVTSVANLNLLSIEINDSLFKIQSDHSVKKKKNYR